MHPQLSTLAAIWWWCGPCRASRIHYFRSASSRSTSRGFAIVSTSPHAPQAAWHALVIHWRTWPRCPAIDASARPGRCRAMASGRGAPPPRHGAQGLHGATGRDAGRVTAQQPDFMPEKRGSYLGGSRVISAGEPLFSALTGLRGIGIVRSISLLDAICAQKGGRRAGYRPPRCVRVLIHARCYDRGPGRTEKPGRAQFIAEAP